MEGMERRSVNEGVILEMNKRRKENCELSERAPEERERMQALASELTAKGRESDVQLAEINEDYRQAMYDEFELS